MVVGIHRAMGARQWGRGAFLVGQCLTLLMSCLRSFHGASAGMHWLSLSPATLPSLASSIPHVHISSIPSIPSILNTRLKSRASRVLSLSKASNRRRLRSNRQLQPSNGRRSTPNPQRHLQSVGTGILCQQSVRSSSRPQYPGTKCRFSSGPSGSSASWHTGRHPDA